MAPALQAESKETGQAPSKKTSYTKLKNPNFIQNETGESEWFEAKE